MTDANAEQSDYIVSRALVPAEIARAHHEVPMTYGISPLITLRQILDVETASAEVPQRVLEERGPVQAIALKPLVN